MSVRSGRKMSTSPKSIAFVLLMAVLMVSLACGLPFGGSQTPGLQEPIQTSALSPLPSSTPILLPPALVESEPPMGRVIPADSPITLFFNQSMDRISVETSIRGQWQQSTFNWVDDATVRVNINEQLTPDTSVAIELGQSIRSRQGLLISKPVSLSFLTADYLRVIQFLPAAEADEVDPTSAVAVSFNRPVVPLGADPASLSPGFDLDPVAEGFGKWLDTSTYVFYPHPALQGGRTYTIMVTPDLKSNDGMPLEKSFTWSFGTALPKLLTVDPATENPWALDSSITLKFNQPMSRGSVESSFSFTSPDGQGVKGTFEWQSDDTQVVFTPNSLLPRNTTFNLVLDGKAQSVGGSPLGTTFSAIVVSVPDLSVSRSEPADGGTIDASSSLVLYFSSPLSEDLDLLSLINLEPRVSDLQATVDRSTLHIFGSFLADTSYVLKISPQFNDVWGGDLDEEYQLRFRTNPLRPNVTIFTGTDAIFLTPADLSLAAQAANIKELPLTLGSVPLSDLFNFLGSNGYDFRQTYHTPDEKSFIQKFNLAPDRLQTIRINLAPDNEALTPGIYALRLDFPQNSENPQDNIYPGPYLLAVSNVQLTFKISKTDAFIWAVDLRTGSPVANAPLSLYDESGNALASGKTDSQGVFRVTFEPRQNPYTNAVAVLDEPGRETFGMAISNWTSGIEPWDFGIDVNLQPSDYFVYLYTDRPIYRPGDIVYFKAIARKAFNGRYTLPDLSSLPLTIFGAEGRELIKLDLPLNAFGTAHGQITLPDDAQPGLYSINSSVTPDTYLNFQVASYRKPEINLTVQFSQDQTPAGQTLEAKAEARYFFEAPAGNLTVHWALYSKKLDFYLPGYQVGKQDLSWLAAYRIPYYESDLGALVSEGDARMGQDGTMGFKFPTEPAETRRRFTLELTIQDESGLPVSVRSSIFVNPEPCYIGLHPDSWVDKAGDQVDFDVKTVDWQSKPTSQIRLRADFKKVRFDRSNTTTKDPINSVGFELVYTPVGSTDFLTSVDGQARLAFTPPEPGTYLLEVYSPESALEKGSRSQILLWVGGESQAIWPAIPNSRLRLTADRDLYRPGDTAQIFIPNPFGAENIALITIERSVIMDYRVLQVAPGGYLLNLPLSGETSPNIVVSVTLLGQNQQGNPDFRQGFINLSVEPIEQKLKVELLTQPDQAGPDKPVRFDIRVTDASGKPVQGEFSLSVVDLAVLALSDPNSADIVNAFYGSWPDGVRTSLSLAVYSQRILDLPTGLGGGGGEETLSVTRENFPDTAFWDAVVVTDQDGKATVSIGLPDTLTTWQVEARGLSLDTQVGQSDTQIISTKDLLIRPVTPRFFVANDRAQISAIVQNNTDSEIQARVSLDPTGFLLDDNSTQNQTITVPAGGRARVEWWGTVQDISQVNFVFSADGSDSTGKQYQDIARPLPSFIPVLSYSAPQTFRTSGFLDDAGTVKELVNLPRSYKPRSGILDVELSPSLASAMIHAMGDFENARFLNTEEILSGLLAYVEISQTLQKNGIRTDDRDKRFESSFDDGLASLLSRQNYDGGWSWWDEGNSDPYVTSYVLFGLQRVRLAGVSINQNVFDQGIDYLKSFEQLSQETSASDSSSQTDAEAESSWQWDRQAFQQFVLAQLDSADPDWIDQIYQQRSRLSPWAQALLALAMEQVSLGSKNARVLIDALRSSTIRTATGAYWEFSQNREGLLAARQNMQTNLSNTAIVLYALASRDAGTPLVADAVRFLMENRDADGGWSSTFATAWTLIGLNQVLQENGELEADFAINVTVNGKPLSMGQVSGESRLAGLSAQESVQSLYPDYPNVLSVERGAGLGRLYYTAGLKMFRPAEEVSPLSNGLTIARMVYPFGVDCEKSFCSTTQSAKMGEKVTVRLTLTLPTDMYYLAVTDFIPAGAEILDTSLKTTQIGPQGIEPSMEPVYNPRDPFAQGWGWWLFSPPLIYKDHIAWTATTLPAGKYDLTYTLVLLQPGEYRVLPATASELYFPEVFANSAGSIFSISP